jgi:chemotaxis protein methyltransferase WspC
VITAIDAIVRERMGIDPAALGPNVLDRAVEGRMLARGLSDYALYTVRLMTEPAERDALAADLAVSETWFFRGGKLLFDRLAGFLADRAARTAGARARALSVPCSTGEEPYSLAIALHERMLTADECAIDAVDQSERVIARATAARYGAFAFREGGADARVAYFRRVERPDRGEEQWELQPHLRAAVRFMTGDLTSPFFLGAERPYDLIICRNLFIYLTPDAKLRAIANFDRLLALDGRLCVTPAEADRLPPGRFVAEGQAEYGIYKRVGTGSGIHRALDAIAPPAAPAAAPAAAPKPAAPPAAPGDLLANARALADAGRLDDARSACELLVRLSPTDADAVALLGVVHLAAGRADAAFDALRKALYLNPDHAEAVSHMMALCERRGDAARAQALRRRLDRLTREDAP